MGGGLPHSFLRATLLPAVGCSTTSAHGTSPPRLRRPRHTADAAGAVIWVWATGASHATFAGAARLRTRNFSASRANHAVETGTMCSAHEGTRSLVAARLRLVGNGIDSLASRR